MISLFFVKAASMEFVKATFLAAQLETSLVDMVTVEASLHVHFNLKCVPTGCLSDDIQAALRGETDLAEKYRNVSPKMKSNVGKEREL